MAADSDPTGDCDDSNGTTYPNATEICDSVDNDCNGVVDDGCTSDDVDGDGFTEAAGDCDDTNPAINPRETEICDGLDNDCDGVVDNGCGQDDADRDGYTESDGDCDDTDASKHPGADETVANGVDDDCDGEVDEDVTTDTADSGDTDPARVSRVGCAGRGSGMSYGAALLPLLALLRLRRRR